MGAEMVIIAVLGCLVVLFDAVCARRPVAGLKEAAVEPSCTLVLALVAAVVGQGASVTRALALVGTFCEGELGTVLRAVAMKLEEGWRWSEAWSSALDGIGGHRRRSVARVPRTAMMVRDALEDAWTHGSSPMTGLRLAIDRADAEERARIERGAAGLSVRILLPVGLCMLPAFICVAVIPLVAAPFSA
ncbi:type II secretion system F family protein [uncultured Bifidobacterium sp.]|uniref:type II secretion system F family protein n=1 Tax=uncultured Bifidobacterium sp. TaxID=165187 RepID=UPI0028DD3F55|nr:type II secretion system F family protein [uncultured Bifidobacterium sp.]